MLAYSIADPHVHFQLAVPLPCDETPAVMENQTFDFMWRNITDRSIGEFESFLGKRALEVDGVYWRQIRFGFYRPLLQFREYPTTSTTLPVLASLGAAQFAVTDGTDANSTLNCLFFEHAADYDVGQLDQNRSRQVKIASKRFVIRPIASMEEFQQKGHAVYLSFYTRTQYNYGASRRDPAVFSRWAEVIFNVPELLILGAYEGSELVAASVSYLSNDTVCYASFFCTTESLKYYVSDLMLHALRSAAAKQREVQRVFAGMYKGLEGLDRFYILRGAARVRLPARISMNPVMKAFLRRAAPDIYSKMMGQFA